MDDIYPRSSSEKVILMDFWGGGGGGGEGKDLRNIVLHGKYE